MEGASEAGRNPIVLVLVVVLDPHKPHEPSDSRRESERSQSSDSFGPHAPIEDEDEDDWGGTSAALNTDKASLRFFKRSGTPYLFAK
jgi:hypothetical protein